jgi:hypothetical protein
LRFIFFAKSEFLPSDHSYGEMVSCILAMDAVGVRFSLVVSFCLARPGVLMHVPTFLSEINACKGRERGAKVHQKSAEVGILRARIFASGGVGTGFRHCR